MNDNSESNPARKRTRSPARPKREIIFIDEFRELYRRLTPESRRCLERLMHFMDAHPEFSGSPAAKDALTLVLSGDLPGLEAHLRRSTLRVVQTRAAR